MPLFQTSRRWLFSLTYVDTTTEHFTITGSLRGDVKEIEEERDPCKDDERRKGGVLLVGGAGVRGLAARKRPAAEGMRRKGAFTSIYTPAGGISGRSELLKGLTVLRNLLSAKKGKYG
ncbi:hypothetical protein HZH68_013774 [Vespula germanica]|uniref:Uncharacterized protein n=1 Tax=Vespula germanica TaxID=30212 RepID=A0A834JBI4_VESGE|nr:hypothetical protein HZH68_013774 [Vespula germanica]